MPADWYTVVNGADLHQGDLLLGCTVPKVTTVQFPLPDELEVTSGEFDLAVLTQSCDLENDKVDEVVLAAIRDYRAMVVEEQAANPRIRSKDWRRALTRGDLPPYSALPERDEPPQIAWSVVDFHHLFSLPKAYVQGFAAQAGDRLRLVPPYREHLAQAFARYMMRVGLPQSLTEFENLVL